MKKKGYGIERAYTAEMNKQAQMIRQWRRDGEPDIPLRPATFRKIVKLIKYIRRSETGR